MVDEAFEAVYAEFDVLYADLGWDSIPATPAACPAVDGPLHYLEREESGWADRLREMESLVLQSISGLWWKMRYSRQTTPP